MKPIRLPGAALLAGLQVACATGRSVSDNPASRELPAPPAEIMAIHTYWQGETPPCPVTRVMELSARSENGLRWGAWNARAQAVVSVRSRFIGSMPATPPSAQRVYEGVAVRFAEGCTAPRETAA